MNASSNNRVLQRVHTLPKPVYYCLSEDKLETLSLYRYTTQEFIDLFFDTGRLRLNSLRIYRAERKPDHKLNVEVEDRQEGKGLIVTDPPHADEKDFSHGFLNLSTSLTCSDELRRTFERAAGGKKKYGMFAIQEPIPFGQAIAARIHARYPLQHILAGKCDYAERRDKLLETHDPDFLPDVLDDLEDKELLSYLAAPSDYKGRSVQDVVKVFFLKEKQLEHQSEFRYLWKSEALAVRDYLDIEVPEAIQYCRLVR
jgi:hypothetical protein